MLKKLGLATAAPPDLRDDAIDEDGEEIANDGASSSGSDGDDHADNDSEGSANDMSDDEERDEDEEEETAAVRAAKHTRVLAEAGEDENEDDSDADEAEEAAEAAVDHSDAEDNAAEEEEEETQAGEGDGNDEDAVAAAATATAAAAAAAQEEAKKIAARWASLPTLGLPVVKSHLVEPGERWHEAVYGSDKKVGLELAPNARAAVLPSDHVVSLVHAYGKMLVQNEARLFLDRALARKGGGGLGG